MSRVAAMLVDAGQWLCWDAAPHESAVSVSGKGNQGAGVMSLVMLCHISPWNTPPLKPERVAGDGGMMHGQLQPQAGLPPAMQPGRISRRDPVPSTPRLAHASVCAVAQPSSSNAYRRACQTYLRTRCHACQTRPAGTSAVHSAATVGGQESSEGAKARERRGGAGDPGPRAPRCGCKRKRERVGFP